MADRLRMLRNHGRQGKYDHEFPGYNVRFNEIKAAIGRVMLKHLDGFNENRRKIAARYNERLKGIVQTPPVREWATPVYHMYVVRCEKRDDLQKFLKASGTLTPASIIRCRTICNRRSPACSHSFRNCRRPNRR